MLFKFCLFGAGEKFGLPIAGAAAYAVGVAPSVGAYGAAHAGVREGMRRFMVGAGGDQAAQARALAAALRAKRLPTYPVGLGVTHAD